MTDATLLNAIGLLWLKYQEYAHSLVNKYRYGTICEKEEANLMYANFLIEEVELYYNDCSCLEEEDICKMITEAQKLLH